MFVSAVILSVVIIRPVLFLLARMVIVPVVQGWVRLMFIASRSICQRARMYTRLYSRRGGARLDMSYASRLSRLTRSRRLHYMSRLSRLTYVSWLTRLTRSRRLSYVSRLYWLTYVPWLHWLTYVSRLYWLTRFRRLSYVS